MPRRPARHLVTFTELGRTTAQAMADGLRELARQLFADLPAGAFDRFYDGLAHVTGRVRALVSDSPYADTSV